MEHPEEILVCQDGTMEPLYRYRDRSPFLNFLLILVGIMFLWMAVFMPDDPSVGGWMWALRLVLVFFGLLMVVVMPEVTLTAWDDHLHIRYGWTKLIGFNLSYEKIKSIKAVEYNPLKDFGGWGIKGGGGEWKGWIAFTASISNKALAIETTEKKYLLGCPNPEEAEAMLRNIVGLR